MEYLIVHETGIPLVNIHNRTAILNQVHKVPSKTAHIVQVRIYYHCHGSH